MTPENNIVEDGFVPPSGNNANQFVARDAFAFYLSYFNLDYVNLGVKEFELQKMGSDLNTRYRNFYNGNIVHMGTLLPVIKGSGSWTGTNATLIRNITRPARNSGNAAERVSIIYQDFAKMFKIETNKNTILTKRRLKHYYVENQIPKERREEIGKPVYKLIKAENKFKIKD